MDLSLSMDKLKLYLSAQLNNIFPDENLVNFSQYSTAFNIAIDRLEFCFDKIINHRYNKDGKPFYNHLYADHNIVFLWFLANTIWKECGNNGLSDKIYYLNKTLHAFDCMYDTALPDIFIIFHGAGTMLGKAAYDNYLVVLQGCTVGAHKGKLPIIGTGVSLTANSSIIGDCKIGKSVSISANTSIFEQNIVDYSVAFMDVKSGKLTLKKSDNAFAQQFFNVNLKSL